MPPPSTDQDFYGILEQAKRKVWFARHFRFSRVGLRAMSAFCRLDKSSIAFLLNPVDFNDAMATTLEQTATRAFKSSSRHHKCEVQDCSRLVASRKRCVRHGGGPRCQVPNCPKGAKYNGLCWIHGGSRGCHVDGCSNRIKARGLCWAHGGGKRCRTPDCPKTALRSGHCWAHGGGKRCLVDGCKRPGYERLGNLCTNHHHTKQPVSTKRFLLSVDNDVLPYSSNRAGECREDTIPSDGNVPTTMTHVNGLFICKKTLQASFPTTRHRGDSPKDSSMEIPGLPSDNTVEALSAASVHSRSTHETLRELNGHRVSSGSKFATRRTAIRSVGERSGTETSGQRRGSTRVRLGMRLEGAREGDTSAFGVLWIERRGIQEAVDM
ncbi:hypothetical protein Ae201684P_017245 [Aphanomyces euteiches]|nr:hypothetical protein Ae201684P_017245 [Aphanomyces euteiches]